MRKLVVATRNPGKAAEVADLLAGTNYDVVSLADYPDAPEVEETGETFVENAVLKAASYARFTQELTLADDSGLEVDALDGAPGVMSSRFAPTDPERISRLLDLLKDVPDEKRSARFRCAIAVAEPDSSVRTSEGTVEGVISTEPAGTNGFGYDPVFCLPDRGLTFAQISRDQKNAVSHRGKALREARRLLLQRCGCGPGTSGRETCPEV